MRESNAVPDDFDTITQASPIFGVSVANGSLAALIWTRANFEVSRGFDLRSGAGYIWETWLGPSPEPAPICRAPQPPIKESLPERGPSASPSRWHQGCPGATGPCPCPHPCHHVLQGLLRGQRQGRCFRPCLAAGRLAAFLRSFIYGGAGQAWQRSSISAKRDINFLLNAL